MSNLSPEIQKKLFAEADARFAAQTGITRKPGIFGRDWPVTSPHRRFQTDLFRRNTETLSEETPWDLLPENSPTSPKASHNKGKKQPRRR